MAVAEATVAAAGAVLLYLVLCGRVSEEEEEKEKEKEKESGESGSESVVVESRGSGKRWSRRRRMRMYARRSAEPPVTWMGKAALVASTVRLTYSETMGRWPLSDLLFGIRHHMRRQGNLEVASVFTGNNCIELKGSEILAELTHMLSLLQLCFLFSKKPYHVLMESGGFSEEDVIIKEPKTGLLKPAFTILRDRNSKTFFLVIRGAISLKDKLTAATSSMVQFHHFVATEGRTDSLIIGYAHSGMVAAARWIAKRSIPHLIKAMNKYPDYNFLIIGHSMGAAIAAILTYIFREHEEFSSTTCVAFGPAACMSWELAESGKKFITSVVNATDLVPTFSAVSVDNLRSEIKASSWLQNEIQHTTFLKGLYHFMTTLRSCMPSLSVARYRVREARTFLHPVSKSTEVVIKKTTATWHSSISCCSGKNRKRRSFITRTSPDEDGQVQPVSNTIAVESAGQEPSSEKPTNSASGYEEIAEGEEILIVDHALGVRSLVLKSNADLHNEDKQGLGNNIDKKMWIETMLNAIPTSSNDQEVHQLFPPGRIIHMVTVPALDYSESFEDAFNNRSIGIYETPRDMYGKIRLSQTMITDHYMPRYKRMMELLIDKLRRENNISTTF
ncbi:uncharacterized protein LOC122009954 [Zingiber officinale]|uniref:Fungal lipase-like domain-containing protein n=1 Tax=Zingiber officinale TaxID=94328 RepID=A0A8J5FG44_ZINOF|nr:uncharacterized protein LOC122009954 [Zingiber officinale]KAG6487659.1 hypothetical protein ZIOFF_056250 [Zingiber officinale]